MAAILVQEDGSPEPVFRRLPRRCAPRNDAIGWLFSCSLFVSAIKKGLCENMPQSREKPKWFFAGFFNLRRKNGKLKKENTYEKSR